MENFLWKYCLNEEQFTKLNRIICKIPGLLQYLTDHNGRELTSIITSFKMLVETEGTSTSGIRTNLELIMDAINLIYNTNIAIFTIRESSIFNYPSVMENVSYHVPDDDYLNYTAKIYSMSKNAFTSCNNYMENIIGSGLKLSDEAVYKLTEEPFYITILYGEKQLRTITSTIFAAIIQVYSSKSDLKGLKMHKTKITIPIRSETNFLKFL